MCVSLSFVFLCLTSRILGCQMCSVWRSSVLFISGTTAHGKREEIRKKEKLIWSQYETTLVINYIWSTGRDKQDNPIWGDLIFLPALVLRVFGFGIKVNQDWLYTRWACLHWNESRESEEKERLPVLLHFHLSSDRMALAGARKAKALAWNKGNLDTSKHNQHKWSNRG